MNITQRQDFVLLFDVKDGNPNGDPDAGNLPRLDAETGNGLVTDVSLKRKVRNYVGLVKQLQPPHNIYVQEKGVLERLHRAAYEAIGAGAELADDAKEGKEGGKKKRKGSEDSVVKARQWMCDNYFDVRTFGAVMSTGVSRASTGFGSMCSGVCREIRSDCRRRITPVLTIP